MILFTVKSDLRGKYMRFHKLLIVLFLTVFSLLSKCSQVSYYYGCGI